MAEKKHPSDDPVVRELVFAARRVLEGLEARIDAAPRTSVPVFDGIADLHDALGAFRHVI